MKVPTSWIKEWLCRTIADREIVDALETAGIEIEQLNVSKPIDEKVVVALVKKVVQHPGAERLKLVQVWTGEREYGVVCGAANVREGLKVAFAQVDAVLPGGDRISVAKLRGETSEGMLCSERELGLGKEHNGILELSSELVEGTPLCDIKRADTVVDIKTPANRFDVLSVVGLAREVSAITTSGLKPLPPPLLKAGGNGPEVVKEGRARRYMLARISIDLSSPSPREVIARLEASGMRAIDPVVDITNYIMLETGQPMHAFDSQRVRLPIAVRQARDGETIVTLDGVKRDLSPADLVIADANGPIALAGVIGGQATEVRPGTKQILLEVATFDAVTVRKMAKRHGLRTEASARFERNLPVQLPPIALGRAVKLLQDIAAGELLNVSDQVNETTEVKSISLSLSRLTKLAGYELPMKEALGVLNRLEISARSKAVGELHEAAGGSHKNEVNTRQSAADEPGDSEGVIVVPEVPWWRGDLKLPEDLVEEIVRVVGYDRIPSTLPVWRPKAVVFDRTRAVRRRVRDLLYGAGLFEVMTYSFVSLDQLESVGLDPGLHLKLKNPLSLEQAYMRSSMLPSHLTVLGRNRAYAKEIGFYEISGVFVKRGKGELPDEPLRLAVTLTREKQAFRMAKGILDALTKEVNVTLQVEPKADGRFAPGRSGAVMLAEAQVGWIGQVHPGVLQPHKISAEAAYFEVDLAPLMNAASVRRYAGLERFPTIKRDITVQLPVEVTWSQVSGVLGALEAEFVDDYYGGELPAGTKSLTFRLTVSGGQRTPTDAEANELEAKAMRRIGQAFGKGRRSH